MNISPVTVNVKSYACNNFSKQAERTCSSNPIQQTAQESSTQKLNINNVQSKLNISFRGEVNPDSEKTQNQKLFDLLKQMDPDKTNKAVKETHKETIDDCRRELRRCSRYEEPLECREMSSSYMKKIAKNIPDEFEEAILLQDKDGNSGFHHEFDYDDLNKIALAQPQVFSKALLLQNQKGETPVHMLSHFYTPYDYEKMKLIEDTAPDAFGEALTMQDKDGNTPLHIIAGQTDNCGIIMNMNKMLIMAEKAPEKFGEAMLIKNNEGDTPIQIVISNQSRDKDCDKKIGLMSKYAPEKLGLSLLIQDKNGNNILHKNHSLRRMEIIQQTAPEKFEEALQVQNNDGKTPIHNLSPYYDNQLEMIAKKAPKGLGKAMIIQDKEGKTPLHYMNKKLVGIAAKAAPEEFKKAMLIKDVKGKTPLYYYTKNKDIDAILSAAENAPDEFSQAANENNIFEKVAKLCLKN
ncbi:MAG: hypothetical protein LUH05_04365 [Candidatus Gastranaerophilales bacterium]|nr:hypothetical protein [Candidatus Gastranaerophilales bacterium]